MSHLPSRKHVLLLPFPAYGHLVPLLELGKKIARHHDVTFAVSECLVQQIQERELTTGADFPLIGIPDGYTELTADNISREKFEAMLTTVQPGVRGLLLAVPTATNPDIRQDALGIVRHVDIVIGDNMMAGPLSICHDRKIPYYFFNTAAATMTICGLVVDHDYPTLEMDDVLSFTEVPPSGGPLPPLPDNMKVIMLAMHETFQYVSGVVINSVQDLEEESLATIKSYPVMKGIPVYFVGPLMPETEKISTGNLEQQEKVRKWLDGKNTSSVVYVSFGSIGVLSKEQMAELTEALLHLNRSFIWSVPSAKQHLLPEEIFSNISEQFDVDDGQFLILSWAPQKMILQHRATSVFVSHCGWNSTLESVAGGVPVVAWPMFSDQKSNAEWLVQHGVAVMLKETGLVTKRLLPAAEIEGALVLTGGSGKSVDTVFRDAAQTWKTRLQEAVGPGGSSGRSFYELVQFA